MFCYIIYKLQALFYLYTPPKRKNRRPSVEFEYEEYQLKTKDKKKVYVYIHNNNSDVNIIYFHGNGEDIEESHVFLKNIKDKMGYNVAYIDYRGYGMSQDYPQKLNLLMMQSNLSNQ